jgi:glutamine amidotransferase
MIAVVDYGLGNIYAFLNIFKQLQIPAAAVSCASALEGADKIILPGVGSFDWAMQLLENSGMKAELNRRVLDAKVPVLGVCLGMQLMARKSEEGNAEGLGWIDAEVKKFDTRNWKSEARLPHMGWNTAQPHSTNDILWGLTENRFYFLHSYYISPVHTETSLASTHYQDDFVCAVHRENIYGVQFHPEKSHSSGIQLLKNFAERTE